MEKSNWSFTSDNGNYQREDFLFTYSEEEKQENEINRNNAQLVLKPEFLTINYEMLHNWFTRYECALYSFIKFFLTNNDRFYCSNEQLAEMLNIGERSVSLGIEKLQKADLIKTKTKIRAWGWKIRFIELQKTTVPNRRICDSKSQKPHYIYNNIIEDNLSNSNELDNIYSPQEKICDLNSNLPVAVEKDVNGVKFVDYYTGCANIAQGDMQKLHEGGCANIAHHNNRAIDNNRVDNNIYGQDAKFNEFWSKYPKKKKKKDALRIFKKYKDPDVIIKWLDKYLDYWKRKGTDNQYIPDPTSWLNQERRNDELEIEKKVTKRFVHQTNKDLSFNDLI